MEKIGILTQYYKSQNYGGLLQAYALVKVISTMGFDVEQISYDTTNDDKETLFQINQLSSAAIPFIRKIKNFALSILELTVHAGLSKRKTNMYRFANCIPHSAKVYDQNNKAELSDTYDVFVVGSDQVWNPSLYSPAYFCDFAVPQKNKCISYAASVSQKTLTEVQQKLYKELLKNFDAISLREKDTSIIQSLTNNKVEWVLDPTLLLDREGWNQVSSERLVKAPYLFCYFLGNDKRERELAAQFAKEKNLKLISIPHLMGNFEKTDWNFGDIQMTAASPEDFISLIKYADYVFTDSFHATVFSHIYNRQFFVFQRAGAEGMSTRIYSLLELFGTEERFCYEESMYDINYLNKIENIDYKKEKLDYERMLEKSIAFLDVNLLTSFD